MLDSVAKLDARGEWNSVERAKKEREIRKERGSTQIEKDIRKAKETINEQIRNKVGYFSEEAFQRRCVACDPKITDKIFEGGKLVFGAGRRWDEAAKAMDDSVSAMSRQCRSDARGEWNSVTNAQREREGLGAKRASERAAEARDKERAERQRVRSLPEGPEKYSRRTCRRS